ncbi:transferase [Sporodiniella umbellata]|nr:transferase [Sporodiniella umbellata]
MLSKTHMIKPSTKYNTTHPPEKILLHGLDNLSAPIQIRLNMFYPPLTVPFDQTIENLQSSLAEALELYLPITGTMKKNERGEGFIAIDQGSRLATPFTVNIKNEPYSGDLEDISPRGSGVLETLDSIFAVKVTQFSCGTIAIGTSFNHQVADLNGLIDFLELWAQISRGEPISFESIPSDWTRTPDRFFAHLLTDSEVSSPPSPPPFSRLSQPEGPAPFLLVESAVTNWRISKDNAAKLKSAFSPTESWISSGDAFVSLLCGAITRARQAANIPRLDKRSTLESNMESIAMAANGRERAPSKNMTNGQYFGNFNTLWSTSVSRNDLLSIENTSGSLIASNIRQNLNTHLSPKSIAQKIAFFDKAQQDSALNNVFWAADMIITNWCSFDLQGPKLDFGWGKPFHSTSGAGGFLPPGYCLLTQNKDTGDFNALLTIEKDAFSSLKKDIKLNEFAQLVQ